MPAKLFILATQARQTVVWPQKKILASRSQMQYSPVKITKIEHSLSRLLKVLVQNRTLVYVYQVPRIFEFTFEFII